METNIERFNIQTKANFPKLLGDFGRDAMSMFPNMPNQFVCAAFVSYREMENWDKKVITEARAQLLLLDRRNENIEDNYVLFKRLVLLLNLPVANTSVHGEARLLDSDSQLRMEICNRHNFEHENNPNIFLQMEKQFVEEFGDHEKYIICMFSHYMPCTIEGHKCAELIQKFSKKHGKQIILSYDRAFDKTNLKLARKIMKDSKNVFCVPPAYYRHEHECTNGNRNTTCEGQGREKYGKSSNSVIDNFLDSTDHFGSRKNARCLKKRRL
ncbi:unnamed protein product [Mytilus coruscus]|uniref:Uncharacterized protein n=1 Tax=Mytilus coruscus TaxID=42192 RepID=A0A6J8C6C9_MYTCO|nr:unnamed protein product [Mytilus coruscus]